MKNIITTFAFVALTFAMTLVSSPAQAWWNYSDNKDPMGDTRDAKITSYGEDNRDSYGLIVTCKGITFGIEDIIENESRQSIRVRFDEEKAETWPVIDFYEVRYEDYLAFTPTKDRVMKMRKHKSLLLEIYTHRNDRRLLRIRLNEFTKNHAKLKCPAFTEEDNAFKEQVKIKEKEKEKERADRDRKQFEIWKSSIIRDEGEDVFVERFEYLCGVIDHKYCQYK